MHNEIMTPTTPSRRYHKRARAESEAQTRRRITEAAVELHGSVGPANTKMTDIARLAGVSRMTVYNHFPTGLDLFKACSTHWAAENPFPEPSAWLDDTDPATRLHTALDDLYGWYDRNEGMLGQVFRDVELLPDLAAVMGDLWGGYQDGLMRALAHGWSSGASRAELRAMLRVVIDFHTWRVLRDSGLSVDRAAAAAARMVARAAAKR
jgi:AcrR family transcriptional regulator